MENTPTTVAKQEEADARRMFACECAANAPSGMSRYQIVHFALGKFPPIGRYHQCCLEIAQRLKTLKHLTPENWSDLPQDKQEDQIEQKRALQAELEIFLEQAALYKPLVNGRTREQLEPEYWDQKFSFDLALRLLTGRPFDDILPHILNLPDGSRAKVLFAMTRSTRDIACVNETASQIVMDFVKQPALLIGTEDAQQPVR